MGMRLRCLVSWLVLIAGTYFCFFTGWIYLWFVFFGVFLLIRWLGSDRIPAPQWSVLGCCFGILGQLLMPVWFVLLGLGMLKVTLHSLDAPRALYALNMTLLLTAVYAVFILGDVLRILKASNKPPPGHCTICGYNLTGNVSGICSECGTPVPRGESKLTGRG